MYVLRVVTLLFGQKAKCFGKKNINVQVPASGLKGLRSFVAGLQDYQAVDRNPANPFTPFNPKFSYYQAWVPST